MAAHTRKKRLTAATHKLLHPRYSCWCIAEIAYYWHLEPATFNRLFITTYGTTPSQARKQRQDSWALDAMEESQVAW